MNRAIKRDVVATLIKAGRRDLAASVVTAGLKKRSGTKRDGDPIPDTVWEAPGDLKLFWFRPGRDDEDAGLYVNASGSEWWWWGLDEQKAGWMALQVADAVADARGDDELQRELKRLGGR